MFLSNRAGAVLASNSIEFIRENSCGFGLKGSTDLKRQCCEKESRVNNNPYGYYASLGFRSHRKRRLSFQLGFDWYDTK